MKTRGKAEERKDGADGERRGSRRKHGNRMEILARAKKIVMEKFQLSESEAHRYIQKRAMDSGTGLVEMSEMVIMLYGSDQ